ncbi:methionine adenosyltransferase [Vibrio celticus]|uniref:S-adenosylmethionine synthase n=1 Tax=Vibrio celticus TaxID=446372 RepID=A0A1C3JEF8_9VIBR|nr:methionine adenosyltransferase [Vibrio celticus]SBT13513.1 S-adenosylmethionine synthase [Vibrio celticus]
MERYLFTSESVSEGHPDKLADQVSDAILDAFLLQDSFAKVACECLIKSGVIIVAGEVNSSAKVDIEAIIRTTINRCGYNSSIAGLDGNSCGIINLLGLQSSNISEGIRSSQFSQLGAGDQGITFGYACDETTELMPAPICYAHKLMKRQALLRKKNVLPFFLPDAKAQITLEYHQNTIQQAHTILVSTQHLPSISLKDLREAVIEEVIKPVIPASWVTSKTQFLVNPAGEFHIGGPTADCGLTGRKIIVDTYGGAACHGGGAFSGKDPSKVDRSAAYMARYIAKNLVAAGLVRKCEIQLAWAIGLSEPISMKINSFGTEKVPVSRLYQLVEEHFNIRVYEIIQHLDLLAPRYQKTACYGHFGRDIFSWEDTKISERLRSRT